jgi:hypothetical protein
MQCLSEAELQAVADFEAGDDVSEHVEQCRSCRERVDQMRRDAARLASVINSTDGMPLRASALVRQAIAAPPPRRGATTLRATPPPGRWRRPAVVSALATAVVVLVVVFGVLPRFGAPTTLSAAQVLGRSLQTLSETRGIEWLDYELVAEGIAHGAWRIEQLIDHDQPTRYRISTYLPDGTLHAALSQDPQRAQRSQLVRIDQRNYIVNVDSVRTPVLSLPQMGQALVETAVTMMQAASDQRLNVVDGPNGRRYVVEMPPVATSNGAATLELYRARVVVSDGDFRLHEFEASGALLRQPFTVSFKLLRQTVRTADAVPASEFEIQPGPDDIVLNGAPSDEPVTELLTTLARELARSQR